MIDTIIFVVLIYTIQRGLRNGTILDLFSFGGLLISLLIAIIFSGAIVDPLTSILGSIRLAQVVSFLAFFFGSFIFSSYLGVHTYKYIKKEKIEPTGNKFGGAIFGLLNGLMISVVFLILVAGIFGGNPDGPDYIQNSILGKPVYYLATKIFHITEEEPEESEVPAKRRNIQKKREMLKDL